MPLTAALAEGDYRAFMTSRARLRLSGRARTGPRTASPSPNVADLERHDDEHRRRTLPSPTASRTQLLARSSAASTCSPYRDAFRGETPPPADDAPSSADVVARGWLRDGLEEGTLIAATAQWMRADSTLPASGGSPALWCPPRRPPARRSAWRGGGHGAAGSSAPGPSRARKAAPITSSRQAKSSSMTRREWPRTRRRLTGREAQDGRADEPLRSLRLLFAHPALDEGGAHLIADRESARCRGRSLKQEREHVWMLPRATLRTDRPRPGAAPPKPRRVRRRRSRPAGARPGHRAGRPCRPRGDKSHRRDAQPPGHGLHGHRFDAVGVCDRHAGQRAPHPD